MNAFAGRTVLVTGGTSGIGLATARAFAGAGASVVVAGRSPERGHTALADLRALTSRVEFVQADVSQAADVERLVDRTVEKFGALDCAVNNAAVFDVGSFKPITAVTEEEYDAHLTFNLKSVWLCLRREIAQMTKQGGGGAIVNTSSINGLGGVPRSALYAAAKAGVLALTKSAALENASAGIRVNALVAGAFRTPMLEGVFERMAPGEPDAAAQRYASMVPLGRIGNPEEAANAVVWLCSDEAGYVTGHSMIVDGGMTSPFR